MKNLSNIEIDSIEQYLSIVDVKEEPRRNRLLELTPLLRERYALYRQHFIGNALELLPKSNYTQLQKSDLLHCYDAKTSSLHNLIALIKRNQALHIRGICQFCGINSDSSTDHYLPKGSYPDFSVKSLNLLPCCPECNSYKGEYYWDAEHNARGLLNLYLDTLPNVQFLFANIEYEGEIPRITFSIQNINGISQDLFLTIELHFKRLHLLRRYKEQFSSIYHQTYSSFKDKPMFVGNPDGVRDFLLSDVQTLFQDYGRNYYKAVIKDALARCDAFVNSF